MDVYLQAQQMSEWLLFNANSSTIFQLYHYNFQWDEDEVRFVLDQYANLDFYSASSRVDICGKRLVVIPVIMHYNVSNKFC
jgi:hypothetical protein